jgi:ATP-dependent helicase/nuclease subunit B
LVPSTPGSASIASGDALEQALAGATLVTAGRRLARALRERVSRLQRARDRQAWAAPAILPWSAWIENLWQELLFSERSGQLPIALDEHQEQLVWELAIESSPESDALLQVASTAAEAAQAWRLIHAWRLDLGAFTAHATADIRAFLAWTRQFETVCRRENWLDQARAGDYLAARLANLRLPSTIILAGFDELTLQQQQFLDACRAMGSVILTVEDPPAEFHAVRAPFPSRSEEIDAAARWARSLVESGATDITVVIRDLHEVRAEVERIFSETLDAASILPGSRERRPVFNVSAGPLLASYPIAHAALLALELSPGANASSLVSGILRSPFFAGAESEWTRRAALDAALRSSGGLDVSALRIERLATLHKCNALVTALRSWRTEYESAPAAQGPAAWARTFSALLAHLGWPGGRALDSAAYQTVEAWNKLLSDFARVEIVRPRMTREEAFKRLSGMAVGRMFQPETEWAPIQILGMLETSAMRFEHLWIVGLDDEHWPGPPKPSPFVPLGLQRAHGLPHASPSVELTFARRITDRLLASAPDIVVSHALSEGDRELGPSPLILGVSEAALALPSYSSYLRVIHESSKIEVIGDEAAPPLEGPLARGGTRVFQLQAQCPFRAFAELRLFARPPGLPASGISPMERGTLVHHAMASIWGELQGHARLCACPAPELDATVRKAVARALDSLAARRGDALPPRLTAIEQTRVERLIHDWLDIEKQRAPFTVAGFEGERYAEAGGVRCKVKVDRVDRLDDGRDVIIDYKTGRAEARSWAGDRPDEPQLPLYAVSHERDVAAVLFGQIRVGETGFKGYAAEQDLVPGASTRDLPAEIGQWRAILDRLGSDFRSGVANVNPKNANACRHCDLLPLCRFTEAPLPASSLEGGDSDA